jgi:hypothetical protein
MLNVLAILSCPEEAVLTKNEAMRDDIERLAEQANLRGKFIQGGDVSLLIVCKAGLRLQAWPCLG